MACIENLRTDAYQAGLPVSPISMGKAIGDFLTITVPGSFMAAMGPIFGAVGLGADGALTVDAANIAFKTSHYADRLVAAGLDASQVEGAVANQIAPMMSNLAEGVNFANRMTISGVLVEWRAQLIDGVVRVGTIFPVK